MPEPGELGGERGAHVPGADDPDAHDGLLLSEGGVEEGLAGELGLGREQVA
jgi:hypothetical protein